ncbi:MAG TPA: hypothetical protein VFZ47_07235, partial [Chitinophagaceae bacterium]
NVRIHVTKSKDSLYHTHMIRSSQGRNNDAAIQLAEKIQFGATQADSIITFPKGFGISRDDKFRNQRVELVFEVPVGKKIQFDERVYGYDWYVINFGGRGRRFDYNDTWEYVHWSAGYEYIMTSTGRLERTDKPKKEDQDVSLEGNVDVKVDDSGVKIKARVKSDTDTRRSDYRYQPQTEQKPVEKKDSAQTQKEISKINNEAGGESPESMSPIYMLTRFGR